jgi:hypothetical protein
MARLGVRYSDSELDDIFHLWRYVGHLVGVEEDFLPVTPEDYARIEALYALTSPGSDDGDRRFVSALTEFQAAELARILPARWARAVVQGLQRSFVGDAVADDLAIPDTWCKRLPLLIGPVTALAYGTIDTLVPRGKERRTARASRTRIKELERLRKDYAVSHQLVDDGQGSPHRAARDGGLVWIRVGCEFRFAAALPVPAVVLVRARPDGGVTIERETWHVQPSASFSDLVDIYGNRPRRS